MMNLFKRQRKQTFLRALVLRNDDFWTIQGLEFDIVAQGKNVHDAMLSFERILRSWVELDKELNRKPFSALPRAPQKYWDMFDECSVSISDRHETHDSSPALPLDLGRPEIRLCA